MTKEITSKRKREKNRTTKCKPQNYSRENKLQPNSSPDVIKEEDDDDDRKIPIY